jgi:hypothetical protein
MEINSYIKSIPQPPVQPPPIEQKRITIDLTFEEFAVVLASVGKCDNDGRERYFRDNMMQGYCMPHRRLPFEIYNSLRRHAIAAGIVSAR